MGAYEHKPSHTGWPAERWRVRGPSPAGWLVMMAALLVALGGAALPLAQPGPPTQMAASQVPMAWAGATPGRSTLVARAASGWHAAPVVWLAPSAPEPPRPQASEHWPARLPSPTVWALARLPSRLLCEGVPGGARLLPDAATLARDQAAAFARLIPGLLAHPEPLHQAVGLYGQGRLDMLVTLAFSTPDPRVAALAMLGCHAQAERTMGRDRASHQPGTTSSACKEPMARRWVQLAPRNAAAWAALASALLDEGRVAEIAPVLHQMGLAREWESYPNLVQAILLDTMPADFTWWQRWGQSYGLSEVGRAIRPGHLSAEYCAPAQEDEDWDTLGAVDPTRLPACAILARHMARQEADEHIAWSGLALTRHLGLVLSETEAGEDTRRLRLLRNSSRERSLRAADLTDEAESGCVSAVRQVRRAMRVHLFGGLGVAREESRRHEQRFGQEHHAPTPGLDTGAPAGATR